MSQLTQLSTLLLDSTRHSTEQLQQGIMKQSYNKIYPNTESVSVVGGEELDPPQFGTVFITIKPQNGDFVSDFDKTQFYQI